MLSLGRIIGCLKSIGPGALLNLPPTLSMSSWMSGFSWYRWWLQGNLPDFWLSRCNLSIKASCCVSLTRVSAAFLLSSTLKGSMDLDFLASRWIRTIAFTAVVHLEKALNHSWRSICLSESVLNTWITLTSGSPTSSSEIPCFVTTSRSHKNLGPWTSLILWVPSHWAL